MKTPFTPAFAVLASAAVLASPVPGAASATPDPVPQLEPGADQRPPRLLLRGRRTQRLAPVLRAYGTCDESCEFEASARVAGVPDLDDLRVVTPAKASDGGTRMRFEVRVSPRAEKLITRALRDGRDVRVGLRVSAFDLADNPAKRSLSIRVLGLPPGSPPLKRS